MSVEIGDYVYVIGGVLTSEAYAPIFVEKAKIENVTNQDDLTGAIVAVGDLGIHFMGKTAFVDRKIAYLAASAFQGNRVLAMTGLSVVHTLRLNELIKNVKGGMGLDWATENFAAWEFLCPDCKRQYMEREFIVRLQIARNIAGIPFVPGSGWRCKKRNTAVGGVPDSSHLVGLAVDIMALTSKERFIIVDALLRAGFMRIGIAKDYIHVDSDLSKPQGIMYLY